MMFNARTAEQAREAVNRGLSPTDRSVLEAYLRSLRHRRLEHVRFFEPGARFILDGGTLDAELRTREQ